ncbi:glycosyltransferase [Jhaorihella thermophila]|uniref:Glycosyltransferase involved in cell wall bisynthesis n=1 Tax=Jhaorihella thermophila TaxID=488547 RepID=A0A1H5Y993_9RHOB|nr:glycosyltransferase [Jhaorihella thermophila]SEG20046.1 Glycosyltransferase involved in cell wall bisynthesis [Jhaorihella thermophila]
MTGAVAPQARRDQWQDRVVLVVSPTPTHPQDYGNRKRIFRICRMLQDAGARIHFVHYASEAEWRRKLPIHAQAAMQKTWDAYYLVAPGRDLHCAPEGTHHLIDEWWDPQLEKTLQWLAERIRPDVAIVNYTWLSGALELMPSGTLKVLDTHDRFSGRKEMLESYGIAPEFFYTTEEEEAEALARADVVWAIKEEERLQFEEMTDRRVITVPHADPASPLPLRPLPADPADFEMRIGVIGARNQVNTRNLIRFLEVADKVFRAHLPPLKLVIGGTVCDLLEGVDLPFVEKLGWIDDVENFYRQIDVALVPMEFSTGLKIKVSEALSHGLPLIAHEHAFEGYRPFHPWHALPSFEAIAEACADLAFQGTEGLEPLRRASAGSHRAVVRDLEAGIAATGAAIAAAAPATLVLGDPAITVRGSFREQLAQGILGRLAERGHLLLYLDGIEDVSGATRLFAGLDPCRIHVSPAVRERLSASDIARLEDAGVRWAGLDQVIAGHEIRHLWLDRLPRPGERLARLRGVERIYLNLAMLRRADVAAVLEGEAGELLTPLTKVTLVGDCDRPLSSRLRRRLGAEQVLAAPLAATGDALRRSLLAPPFSSRKGLTVILEHPSEAIVEMAAAVAVSAGQNLVNVVTLETDETELRSDLQGGVLRRHLPGHVLDREALRLLRTTRLTAGFAPESLRAGTLLAALESAGHDVMRFGAPQTRTLLSCMRRMQARLIRPGEDMLPGRRQHAVFYSEPGWRRIRDHWAEPAP